MLKFLLYFNLLASFLGMGQAISFGKLGGGINNNGYYTPVRGMFYDTIDKIIYVSGQFAQADNKTVWGVARWHNNMWDSLRGGFAQFPQQTPSINSGSQSWAWTITRFQNKIYFAGGISYVSGQLTCCMAVWNGTTWDPPMAQLPNGLIYGLKVYNNSLYACGEFTKFGTTTCNYIAKYDGISWQPVGDFSNFFKTYGPPTQVTSLEFFNNELYVAGAFDDSTGTPKNIANVSILNGNGNGVFLSANTLNLGFYSVIPGGTNVMKAVDCTGDNKLDIAGVKGDSLYFLKGNGNFTFSQPTAYYVGSSPSGIDFSDFNNDGKMDLVTANKYSQDYTVLVGNGSGLFTNIVTYSLDPVSITSGFWPTSLVTTDVNNDGKRDIIIGYDNCFNLSILLNCNTVDVGLADNIKLNNDYKLYPNPAIDHIDLKFSEEFESRNKIEIINSVGQLIKEEDIILNDQVTTISLNDLPNGVYLLSFYSDKKGNTSKRFVISK